MQGVLDEHMKPIFPDRVKSGKLLKWRKPALGQDEAIDKLGAY